MTRSRLPLCWNYRFSRLAINQELDGSNRRNTKANPDVVRGLWLPFDNVESYPWFAKTKSQFKDQYGQENSSEFALRSSSTF